MGPPGEKANNGWGCTERHSVLQVEFLEAASEILCIIGRNIFEKCPLESREIG